MFPAVLLSLSIASSLDPSIPAYVQKLAMPPCAHCVLRACGHSSYAFLWLTLNLNESIRQGQPGAFQRNLGK